MTVHPFPPREAGRLLAAALGAAERAGSAEADRRKDDLFAPGGLRRIGSEVSEISVMQAALNAALPLLRGLTSDARMAEIVAHGMAEEVMLRLRKRGAA